MAKKIDYTCKLFLGNTATASLPHKVSRDLAKDLSDAISLYFCSHPDDYEKYLQSAEHQKYLSHRRCKK